MDDFIFGIGITFPLWIGLILEFWELYKETRNKKGEG